MQFVDRPQEQILTPTIFHRDVATAIIESDRWFDAMKHEYISPSAGMNSLFYTHNFQTHLVNAFIDVHRRNQQDPTDPAEASDQAVSRPRPASVWQVYGDQPPGRNH